MTQNNNLSVLPFYTDIEQQNHRKSYAFGAIYPLFAPANILLPFQIMREHRATYNNVELPEPLNTYNNYYINEQGALTPAELGYNVASYSIGNLNIFSITFNDFSNANGRYGDAAIASIRNKDGSINVLSSPESIYTGTWEINENASILYVQIKARGTDNNDFSAVTKSVRPIESVTLYKKNGVFVYNLINLMLFGGLQIVDFPNMGYDIIVFPAKRALPINMLDGIYYLQISDGVETWFSEMFTIVHDMTPYLKIEWWNNENLVFDAGQIVYQNPTYQNRLYLCTELGKPEYKFDEEGETRDGYYFPTKQISEKVYKCTFLAPEYLCDVMRLIRMADHIRVIDKYGRQYNVDTFLITPQWQTQGDLASVEIEFETDTVVKKTGKGYTI